MAKVSENRTVGKKRATVKTLAELAREIGCSAQTVGRYAAVGIIKKKSGRYHVAECRHAMAEHKSASKPDDDAEIKKWQRRRVRAIALRGETELKKTLGEYVRLDSVREAYLALAGVIRSTFQNAASRWSMALEGMDAVARKRFLDGEIRRALERVDEATKSISIEVAELDAEDAAPQDEEEDA